MLLICAYCTFLPFKHETRFVLSYSILFQHKTFCSEFLCIHGRFPSRKVSACYGILLVIFVISSCDFTKRTANFNHFVRIKLEIDDLWYFIPYLFSNQYNTLEEEVDACVRIFLALAGLPSLYAALSADKVLSVPVSLFRYKHRSMTLAHLHFR